MGVGGSGNPFSPGYQGQTSQSMFGGYGAGAQGQQMPIQGQQQGMLGGFGGGGTMGGWPGQQMQGQQQFINGFQNAPVPNTQSQVSQLSNSLGGLFGNPSVPTGLAPLPQQGQQMPMQGQMLDTRARLPMQGSQFLQPGQTAPPVNLNSMNLGSLFNDLQGAAPSAGLASLPQQGQQTGLQHYGPRDDMTFGNR
jgi:hypothetical protein